MNIVKHELHAGMKSFLLWTLGLFFLDFAGLTKFTGISGAGNADVMKLMNQFPRIVLAVFGMVGLDINSLGGYYSVLAFYALICISIYGIYLGTNSITRESVDKTYEFLFTKPRTRSYILGLKLFTNTIFLAVYSMLHVIISIVAVMTLKIDGNINSQMVLFGVSGFLVGILFFSLGAFLSSIVKRAEKGALYSNLCFFLLFLFGVIFDMSEDNKAIQIVAPLKYFLPTELLDNHLNPIYTLFCIITSGILLFCAVKVFCAKDLTAI